MTNTISKPSIIPCPNCQGKVLMTAEYPHRPFCSERCKLIDLGEWAAENHAIPGDEIPVYPNGEPESN